MLSNYPLTPSRLGDRLLEQIGLSFIDARDATTWGVWKDTRRLRDVLAILAPSTFSLSTLNRLLDADEVVF